MVSLILKNRINSSNEQILTLAGSKTLLILDVTKNGVWINKVELRNLNNKKKGVNLKGNYLIEIINFCWISKQVQQISLLYNSIRIDFC